MKKAIILNFIVALMIVIGGVIGYFVSTTVEQAVAFFPHPSRKIALAFDHMILGESEKAWQIVHEKKTSKSCFQFFFGSKLDPTECGILM